MATGFEFDNVTGTILWDGQYIGAVGGVLSGMVYNCPVGVAVGDAVYLSGADTIDQADAGSPALRPCIGVVRLKPTAATALVQYGGEAAIYGGLVTGATYYLAAGTPGAITNVPPSGPGETVQALGFARSSTSLVILLDPADVLVQ